MAHGTHDYEVDPRNEDIQININGELLHRSRATVSVFDSGYILGDGVWEGMRLHNGTIFQLDRHLDRLYEGAKALDMDIGLTQQEMTARIYDTCAANDMEEGVHIRLMVTRGLKSTPFQGTAVNVGGPTRILLAEWKDPPPALFERGLSVVTVPVRRGRPDVQDPAWNSHSKLNCVSASIAAARAGGDEGLMLDPHGFVATCNSTHFFVVRRGTLLTSTGRYCLRGITRQVVLDVARAAGIPTRECDFPLTWVYGAQEAFCTGTYAGIIPVNNVDGRAYALPGPVTTRLRALYGQRIAREVSG